jgi:16S rRNA (cytosine967-C5)-methyltransferase
MTAYDKTNPPARATPDREHLGNGTSQVIPAARAAALTTIEKTLPVNGKPGQDLQAVLDQCLGKLSDPRDKALTTELAYGYLRFKGRLDHLVRAHLDKPDRTPPGLVRIVGLAAHELVHLHVPPHATLSWAVDAVKARFGQAQAGVANAVLRRIQALGLDAANPDFYQSSSTSRMQFLAAWHSCPQWLVRLWLHDYDQRTALWLLGAQLRQPLTGVRVNALRPGARDLFENLSQRAAPLFSQYPWLGFDPAETPGLAAELVPVEREGRLTRQSPAVGDILSRLSHQEWPEPIWDACAGRGGKTAALLELGHTRVFSSDVNRRRLRGLASEAHRLSLPTPLAFLADASTGPLSASKGGPGTILIDAPCSGLGVLARRPDAKWKRAPGDIANLASIQGRIIQACARLLPEGGRLVYLTCTMTREENDRQAEALEPLGFAPVALCEPTMDGDLREFFWGGVWRKIR